MSQALEKAEHNSLLNRDFPNQHPISAIEGLKEALEGKVTRERKVNGQTLDKDVEITEVKSAEKFKTARTVSLSGAVVSTPTALDGSKDVDIPITEIKEAYLEWGGKHNAVYLSPIDVAMLPELNANRVAFIERSAVKFERSSDAGATWTDVSADFDGTLICTKSLYFGNGNTVEDKTVDRQHRITIDCISGGVYCELAKIMLYIGTMGAKGCVCKVEGGDNSANTLWTTITEAYVSGWSGWNSINFTPVLIGKETKYRYIRLTFTISGINADYSSDLAIMSIRFFSSVFYSATNSLAKDGTLYAIDRDQNAFFPNNIIAKGGKLQLGNTTLTETQLQALLALLT